MRHFFRPEVGIFLAFWAFLVVGGRERLFQDPGTFWHTRVGERIFEVGFFDADPYTFTRHGERWVPHQWLGECLMALVHRAGGLDALLAVSAALIAAVYAWLAVRLTRTGLHWSLAGVAAVAALGASATHFHVRPHLATIACLAVTFALVCDVDSGRRRPRSLWWLVPLFWFWANVHGGMLAGLGTLAVACAGWTVWRIFGRESPVRDGRDVAHLLGVGLLSAGLVFVNPYGAGLPAAWSEIMNTSDLRDVIREHAPLDPADPKSLPFLVFAAGYLVAFAGLKRPPNVCWLIPLLWLYLATDRVRHAPLFVVVALLAAAEFLPHTRWPALLKRIGDDWYVPGAAEPFSGWRILAAALVVSAVALAVQRAGWRGWAELDPDRWPVAIEPAIRARQHDVGNGNARIFNEFRLGGFLIYHAPGYRVFVDDRCELFGGPWLTRYVEAESRDTAGQMRRWAEEYGEWDFALVLTGSGYDRYFHGSDGWELLAGDATARFYGRSSAPPSGSP